MYGRKPTKLEKEWEDAICDRIGCIVCLNEYGIYSPACPHHIEGKTKPGCHFKTIPLCGRHHQTGGEGIAYHATGKKTWYLRYGSENDLLKQCQEIINGQT